uniref:Protein farnesyltransferase/geranylgeranyltransferase type-1 subunit alpha n=1 Tax=Ascaris suum TaxID=6253 RepID=F1L0I0_ASCSU
MKMEDEIERFRDDPAWDDVEPLPLNDDEQAAVKVTGSDAFNDAFMYLRAVVKANEMSERAFVLTNRCIELNPANYTVWHFRRLLLKALNKDLNEEFAFIEETIEDNPKNYQVWHHRQILVEWTNDPSRELAFTARMIADDWKNYHAWQLRIWVVDHFKMYGQPELDYATELLLEDVRNNSAWSYRYFIIQGLDALKDEETLNREIAMTEACIKKAPSNESAWNYLAGILFDKGISTRADVMQFCEDLVKHKRVPSCLMFMVDSIIEQVEKRVDVKANEARATSLLTELKQIDPMRSGYYDYQQEVLRKLIKDCKVC